MPLSGGMPPDPGSVVQDLTIAEVHAFGYGFLFSLAAFVAYTIGFPTLSLGFGGASLVLLGWTSTSKTQDLPLVSSIITSLPSTIKGQIREERHYYGTGLVLGSLVGLVTYLTVNTPFL